MADITAREVKALRDATGAGMMDAKRALVECDGDAEAASQLLREKGLAKAAPRSDRQNVEGAVGLVSDGRRAALVHLKCETDFSAKSEGFLALVDELTNAVLSEGVSAVDGRTSAIDDLRLSIKENIEVGRVDLIEAADGKLELRTAGVGYTETAKEVTAGHRLYGNVEGDLLYAYDMAAVGQELQPHLWARLKRA